MLCLCVSDYIGKQEGRGGAWGRKEREKIGGKNKTERQRIFTQTGGSQFQYGRENPFRYFHVAKAFLLRLVACG